MTLAEKLLTRHRVNVRTPVGLRFTIQPRSPAGFEMVRGYGIILRGKSRPVRTPILSREQVEEWAADLIEDEK